jgi:hypothetical protein
MPEGSERDKARGRDQPTRHGAKGKAKGPRGERVAKGRGPKKGGLALQRIDANEFALVHPKCIHEMELDFAEGVALRREGDLEAARDALRFALQGCGDNMWVHVELGRIALEDFNDPTLARGHFGYAFELAKRAIPPGFSGRIPRRHPMNEPLYSAVEGLVACYEQLGKRALVDELRRLVSMWEGEGPRMGPRGGRV